jgi:hypothetical protein
MRNSTESPGSSRPCRRTGIVLTSGETALDLRLPECHRIRRPVTEALLTSKQPVMTPRPVLLRASTVYSTMAMTSISTMRPW